MSYMTLPVYNIDSAVGSGKTNKPDDVRLVQELLKAVAKAEGNWAPPTPLPVDGRFSNSLRIWIVAFQTRSAVLNPGKVVVDGLVDPIPMNGDHNWDPKLAGGIFSTMYGLNYRSWKANRQTHIALGQRLNLRDGRD